jgi:hypothetical protein
MTRNKHAATATTLNGGFADAKEACKQIWEGTPKM